MSLGPDSTVLSGRVVRLEPLSERHRHALLAAAAADPSLYRWSPVPQDISAVDAYIEAAVSLRNAGRALPFATVRLADGCVIGSTRFWNIEQWPWPNDSHGRSTSGIDVCEIGYTWLTRRAIRTAANTEAKLLMLTHAFEKWHVFNVCFHTDVRNERSREALVRLGATFEGVLRAHRLAVDFVPRDSARFSIVASEWPAVKDRLIGLLNQRRVPKQV
jgi:RimJ/RimL family protein N-acetyltransferase